MASEQGIKQYLEEVRYPASTYDLITAAKNDGASEETIDRLNQFPSHAEFSGPDQVVEQLQNLEESGVQMPEHEVE